MLQNAKLCRNAFTMLLPLCDNCTYIIQFKDNNTYCIHPKEDLKYIVRIKMSDLNT